MLDPSVKGVGIVRDSLASLQSIASKTGAPTPPNRRNSVHSKAPLLQGQKSG